MIDSVGRVVEYNNTQRSELQNHLRPDQHKQHVYVVSRKDSYNFPKSQMVFSKHVRLD